MADQSAGIASFDSTDSDSSLDFILQTKEDHSGSDVRGESEMERPSVLSTRKRRYTSYLHDLSDIPQRLKIPVHPSHVQRARTPSQSGRQSPSDWLDDLLDDVEEHDAVEEHYAVEDHNAVEHDVVEEHDKIDNKTEDSSSSIGNFSEFEVEAADSPVSVNSEFSSCSGNISDFNETLEDDS